MNAAQVNVSQTISNNIFSRTFWLLYGLGTYAIGAGALFWFLFAISGLAVAGFGPIQTGSATSAIAVNLLLVFQFGVSHSIMARSRFKAWIKQHIPAYAERSTFVLVAGISMALCVWNWQTIPGTAWEITNTGAITALWVLNLFGIGYLLASSFITNHFELFGLRQVWLNFRNIAYTPLEFKQQWMYRYSRHPMMLGLLIVFWCMPVMSVTRLVIALMMTAYIFIGVYFEERSLVEEFGENYEQYRKNIGMFFSI
jgi:protein-S-isoprenylcysteine O-methyltransferase Ste14